VAPLCSALSKREVVVRDMQENVDHAMKSITDFHDRQDFGQLGPKDLAKLSDKELALFQSNYPNDSPQNVLANHEWQRRLIAEQAKTSRLVALVGIIGTLIGVLAGHFLSKW